MKTDYTESKAKLISELALIYEGKKLGYITGFKTIDEMVGSLQKGHFWVIGGYTSVGKSYWLINVLTGILQNQTGLKIAVFSSEMRQEDYILRHVCVLNSIWEGSIENSSDKKQIIETITDGIKNYEDNFNGNDVDIYGNAYEFDFIKDKTVENKYDIILVDYVNKLSYKKIQTEDKAMPFLARNLDKLSKENNVAVIALSQLNVSSVSKDYSSEKVNPFSWGKNLFESCDVAILLEREKKDDELSNLLKMRLLKHRRRELKTSILKINAGYKLTNPDQYDYQNIDNYYE